MKNSKSLMWFYILVTYVLIQFIWWLYMLFVLNNEIYYLKSELILYKSADSNQIIKEGNDFLSKLHNRWLMIVGEGSVFVTLLVLGIIQIRKTFKKERELANLQKNFLLSVTHELKSPIASVKLQLETLIKRDLSKDQQQQMLSGALSETERLNILTENILLASRIENSAFAIYKEEVNVAIMLHEILKTPINQVRQKVVLNCEDGILMKIDKMLFPSIILNIFENAAKYSAEDSTITIGLRRRMDKVYLSVSDEGAGIVDSEKSAVFEKFYRTGNEETRRAKGTGLGLYIVNYLVNKHNGSISIKDNSPKGSIFEIEFDLR